MFRCARCVLQQSEWNIHRCEACMYAWTGFMRDGTSHTSSQFGGIGWTGNTESRNLLILSGKIKKKLPLFLVMWGSWLWTVRRPAALVFADVWSEGDEDGVTHKRCTPPPLLLPSASLPGVHCRVWAGRLPPPWRPVAGPAEGAARRCYTDLVGNMEVFVCLFGGGVVIDFVGSKRLPKINPEPMPGLKVVLSLTPEHFKGNTLSTRLVSKGL